MKSRKTVKCYARDLIMSMKKNVLNISRQDQTRARSHSYLKPFSEMGMEKSLKMGVRGFPPDAEGFF